MINKIDVGYSIRQQCKMLGVNRSSLYYESTGESNENLHYMHLLDEQFTRTPFYGVEKMTAWLRQDGYNVNPKRIRRLLRKMGLEAIYQKPNTSKTSPQNKIFPYLLRGKEIGRCDQVWSTDITYVRLRGGFVYLMAVIDWYSRYVLTWSLSTTMESDFCINAVGELLPYGQCEIFNTDQGAQFTTPYFTQPLLDKGINISMDGRGRALDNIFVERLWRSVKYEHIYLRDIHTVKEAYEGLKHYFYFYNNERLHQSLDYRTPASVYKEQSEYAGTLAQ